MTLDVDLAHQALSRLAKDMNLSIEQAALGMVKVANTHMERALRLISVERGHDPRDYTLLSFGGAGGLHAADLARALGIPCVLVPPLASTLSAYGMLVAEVVKDYIQTVMLPGDTSPTTVRNLFEPMVIRGYREIETEGIPAGSIRVDCFLDMRYKGQSYELMVPFVDDFILSFHSLHTDTYGYAQHTGPVEIVNLHLRAVGHLDPPHLEPSPFAAPDPSPASLGTHDVFFSDLPLPTIFYRGELLQPGNRLVGPAVVVRSDTTILLGASDRANVDEFHNLIIEVGK